MSAASSIASSPSWIRTLVASAGLAILTNLFLIYTTGEPVEYVLPGQPAAAAGH